MTEEARKAKVITQMGNQAHAGEPIRRAVELIQAGIVGKVREAHIWTNRPIWPQGMPTYPKAESVPAGLNWDLWIGPAEQVGYSPEIAPFKWRGFWNFGCGALGDMACHIMDMAFWALELDSPTSVKADFGGATEVAAPNWSTITYQFPKKENRGPIKLVWYDGKNGDEPNVPPASLLRGENADRYGSAIVGDKGIMYFNRNNLNWVVKPTGNLDGFEWPERTIPRVKDGDPYVEWVEALKSGVQPLSNFEQSGPFTEVVLLGNLSFRLGGQKIEWDGPNLRSPNTPEAVALIRRPYRDGWEIS